MIRVENYLSDEVVVCSLMIAQISIGVHITEVIISVTMHTVINYVEHKHKQTYRIGG